jgi:predicted DsbA family dithiol-disulfide isomerase
MQVEVWSDVVCPWCYIGKRKLETALSRFAHADQVEVVWRSFQLDPSIPEGHTEATLPALAAKYGRSVEEMAQMQVRGSSTTSPTVSAATPCSPTSSSTWPPTVVSAGP